MASYMDNIGTLPNCFDNKFDEMATKNIYSIKLLWNNGHDANH